MKNKYLFKSERLGFRQWTMDDHPAFAKINGDKGVMEYFPGPLSHHETAQFIERMIAHYDEHGYNYFAVDILETEMFIGFIGLAYQSYEAPFNPATDIGWRLTRRAWGKGYATEGAKRCLEFAFNELHLDKIVSVCTLKNTKSENVMQKIGMKKMGEFKHPKLANYPKLEECVWYEIENARIQ